MTTNRHQLALEWLHKIDESEGGMDRFTKSYESMGFSISETSITYREWVFILLWACRSHIGS